MVPRKPNVKCWQREAPKSKQAQTSMVERFWQTERERKKREREPIRWSKFSAAAAHFWESPR